MPLCYLIAAAYIGVTLLWDRLSLLGLRQPAQRYSKQLPRAIMRESHPTVPLVKPCLLANMPNPVVHSRATCCL